MTFTLLQFHRHLHLNVELKAEAVQHPLKGKGHERQTLMINCGKSLNIRLTPLFILLTIFSIFLVIPNQYQLLPNIMPNPFRPLLLLSYTT